MEKIIRSKKGEKEKEKEKENDNIAPFLSKCYEMVEDERSNGIICWSESDDSFIILNMLEFTTLLLPNYFKHNNFSSFMRQLNIYGFRKADTDRWEFTNDNFVKGQKHLLKSIKRRKNIQSSTQKNSIPEQPVEVSNKEYVHLEKEVETLKTDKLALMQELSSLIERQESSQNKLILLRERLQGMENNQQQLLSFLVMVMQSPGLLVQLLQPKENSWRVTQPGKFTLDEETGFESAVVPDGSIVRYQPMSTDEVSTPPSFTDTLKNFEHDFSFNSMEDFLNFNTPPTFDENLNWSVNCGSPPRLDLEKLEQYLLSSPTRDCAEERHGDDDQTLASEIEMEKMFCSTLLQDSSEGINHPVSVETLTEKMGCLSPGRKIGGTKERK